MKGCRISIIFSSSAFLSIFACRFFLRISLSAPDSISVERCLILQGRSTAFCDLPAFSDSSCICRFNLVRRRRRFRDLVLALPSWGIPVRAFELISSGPDPESELSLLEESEDESEDDVSEEEAVDSESSVERGSAICASFCSASALLESSNELLESSNELSETLEEMSLPESVSA